MLLAKLTPSIGAIGLFIGPVFGEGPTVDRFGDVMPQLIRRSTAQVQASWIAVQKAVAENEKLKHPLPEPYLARAEIWAVVNNHEDALKDCLAATEFFLKNSPTLTERSRYFIRLDQILRELESRPHAYFPDDAIEFGVQGRSYYDQGRLEEALVQFTEAVRLMPDGPVYRFFRALTLKRLGREAEADRDAWVGANAAREAKENGRLCEADIAAQLERVQGPLRRWLEAKREEVPPKLSSLSLIER